ncbi:MAG TPA: hypothetical protein VMS40_10645 [Vicinamibacterales bacterium]|nr:hypothetical protein [Vicinamibacterales bacterium]
MTSLRAATSAALVTFAMLGGPRLYAQSPTDLAGSWTLNRQLSQFPQEVGFSASFLPIEPAGGGDRQGRRGSTQTDTQEGSTRVRFLTDEVRVPPERLTIEVTPAIVTITPDPGAVRTVQPGLRDQQVKVGPITAITNTSWDAGRLTIAYTAGTSRLLRYTYSVGQNPGTLTVEVEFVEGNRSGDRVRRVYERTAPDSAPSTTTAPRGAAPPSATFPASSPAASGSLDQRPDASLKGLTRLGIVVEGLGAEAAKCGLKQEGLETAVTKRLTDTGLGIVRFSDDDTYLYVNVNTVTASTALCVSRYDVTVYSHAAAQLTHTASPVLLQVELLHKGGLAGGTPAAHADGVLKSVLEYVDQFSTRIRDANK